MAIVFNNVSYLGEIKDMSFEIENNKITGIIGSSGSGKSTVIDLMSGVFEPSRGSILYEEAGVVYQNVHDQFFYNSVKEEFIYFLRVHHIMNIEKKMFDAIKMVGFDISILDASPFELSLSEQKKLSLALVLSINPKVILLDDVFFGLDDKSKESMIRLIRKLKIRYGRTIVVVSRDVNLIYRISDKVILIDNGEVVKISDKYDIFTDVELLEKCNLPTPKLVEFSNIVKSKKNIDLGFRDDINDLMKDIYRFVR